MGAGAMTLAELQVILTANIAQILPQVQEARKAFQSLDQSAATAGDNIDKSVSQTASKTEKSLDTQNKAEQKSADTAKKAATSKRQSLEEIAEIAKRAAQRYTESVNSMGSNLPIRAPEPITGSEMATTAIRKRQEAAGPEKSPESVQPTALERLRDMAIKARQEIVGMFTGSRSASDQAQAALDAMTAKLDNINARADMQRQKLSSLQAEYTRLMNREGGTGSPAAEKLQGQILAAESRLQSLTVQSDKTAAAIEKMNTQLNDTGKAGEKAASGFRTASAGSNGFQRELSRMGRQIISQILVYQLFFSAVSTLGTYMWNALKTNTAFSNSLNNLKVQFLTAFQPIYQAALPALTSLINALAKATAYIAAFISGFFGKTYAQSEQAAAGLNKNVQALQDTAKAAQDAKKALAGFDEINTLSKSSTSSTAATGADASLLNTDFSAPSAKPLISETQIAQAEAAGERVREVFDTIYSFAKKYEGPIKAAILGIIGAFLLFKIVMFVKGMVEGIGTAIAFLVENPVVAVVLAIGLIVIGLIYLWNTNKKFRTDVTAIWNDIKDSFLKVWDQMKLGVKMAGDSIQDGWRNAKDSFLALWNDMRKGADDARNAIENGWKEIGPWFGNRWSDIQRAFGDVRGWFVSRFSEARSGAESAWNTVGSWFGGRWNDIQNAFGDVREWFWGVSQDAYNGVTRVWSGLREFFGGLWNDIKWGVRSFLNDLIYPINEMIYGIDLVQFKVPGWVPVLGGDHFGLDVPQIPYLASGGITTGATAAIIGESEQEAVLPLQNNTGWMDAFAAKVAAQVPKGGGDITVTIPVYLDRSGSLIDTITRTISRNTRNGNDPLPA